MRPVDDPGDNDRVGRWSDRLAVVLTAVAVFDVVLLMLTALRAAGGG